MADPPLAPQVALETLRPQPPANLVRLSPGSWRGLAAGDIFERRAADSMVRIDRGRGGGDIAASRGQGGLAMGAILERRGADSMV